MSLVGFEGHPVCMVGSMDSRRSMGRLYSTIQQSQPLYKYAWNSIKQVLQSKKGCWHLDKKYVNNQKVSFYYVAKDKNNVPERPSDVWVEGFFEIITLQHSEMGAQNFTKSCSSISCSTDWWWWQQPNPIRVAVMENRKMDYVHNWWIENGVVHHP